MSIRAPVTSFVTFPTTKLSVRMKHIHTFEQESCDCVQCGCGVKLQVLLLFSAEIFSGLVGAASILSLTRSVLFFYICVNAAKILHNRMFGAVLRAPIRFFDTNPIGTYTSRMVNLLCLV